MPSKIIEIKISEGEALALVKAVEDSMRAMALHLAKSLSGESLSADMAELRARENTLSAIRAAVEEAFPLDDELPF